MTTFKEYSKVNNNIVVAILDEDSNVVGFTVADRNKERLTSKKFHSASKAIEWANANTKGLLNE